MATLTWGGASFLLAFLAHILVWRVSLPERQTRTLLLLMFSVLFATLALLVGLGGVIAARYGWSVPETPGDYLHLALLNVSLVFSYLITYSAIEADSPSLVIVLAVAEAGPDGLPEEALGLYAGDDILVKPRIKDLLRDKMASFEGGRYRLTLKGRLLAAVFIAFRKLLGRGKGG